MLVRLASGCIAHMGNAKSNWKCLQCYLGLLFGSVMVSLKLQLHWAKSGTDKLCAGQSVQYRYLGMEKKKKDNYIYWLTVLIRVPKLLFFNL